MLPLDYNVRKNQKSFNSHLSKNGFTEQYRDFVEKISSNSYSVFYGNIKNIYKKYVVENGWPEDKLETILVAIAEDMPKRKHLISFKLVEDYGEKYDKGYLDKYKTKKNEYLEFNVDDDDLEDYLDDVFGDLDDVDWEES